MHFYTAIIAGFFLVLHPSLVKCINQSFIVNFVLIIQSLTHQFIVKRTRHMHTYRLQWQSRSDISGHANASFSVFIDRIRNKFLDN